jgi:hypothetical protein
MSSPIPEDCRALRGFYPDPVLRHQVHYAFAHSFVPQYVHQNPFAFFSYLFNQSLPGGAIDPTRFIHSRWSAIFLLDAGLIGLEANPSETEMAFRRVTDLGMTLHELNGRPVALIHMPVPEQCPDAFFVAVVLLATGKQPDSWPSEVQARVFTLEHGVGDGHSGEGVPCEWTVDGTHHNFGRTIVATPEAFLQAIGTLLG